MAIQNNNDAQEAETTLNKHVGNANESQLTDDSMIRDGHNKDGEMNTVDEAEAYQNPTFSSDDHAELIT